MFSKLEQIKLKIKNVLNKENIFKFLFLLCALIAIFAVITICLFLFSNAIPTIVKIGFKNFIFGTEWFPLDLELFGIFPMIIGTFYVTALSLMIGIPIGILSAIYLSQLSPSLFKRILTLTVELLGAIPSVVYGFFGLLIIVPFISDILNVSGKNLLSASLVLSIMILPTMILISKSALESVPKHYDEAAIALGITP